MARKYVNELTDGEAINEIFLASEKQLRPNRNGDLYLQVRLSDNWVDHGNAVECEAAAI